MNIWGYWRGSLIMLARSGATACLACLVLLLVAVPADAFTITAAAAQVRSGAIAISVVPSGQRVVVHIKATAGSRCTLRVTAKRKSAAFPSVYISRRDTAAVAWTVPADAPSGEWAFAVTCRVGHKTDQVTKRFLLVNHGDGRGDLREKDSTKVIEGGLGGKGAGPCNRFEAWNANQSHCEGFPGDPFNSYHERSGYEGEDVGQCTWYAAGRRPDLWGITRGNANTWLKEAQGRVLEGSEPVPGAIAVQTSGQFGHVAYVVGVSGSNVIVDDSNYDNDVTIRENHAIPESNFAGYIYGGPAGNGPSAGSPPVTGAPQVTTTSLPGGLKDQPYSATLTASGGSPGYSWSLGSGSLPAGLTLAPSGAISGVPTELGTGTFAVTVTDSAGRSATETLTIAIGLTQTKLSNIAAQGPADSLDFYDNGYGSPTWAPTEVAGPNTAFSTPSIAIESNDDTVIAVQGPNNSLDFYFNVGGQPGWTMQQIAGPGSVYSAPSIALESNNNAVIAVQGPNHSLEFYFNIAGNPAWYPTEVAGPGTTFSTPSIALESNNNAVIAAQGPSNSLDFYFNSYGQAPWYPTQVAGAGTTFSAPSIALESNNNAVIAVQGPSNSLFFYLNPYTNPAWYPTEVAATGTTFSAPSIALESNNNAVIAAQGVEHSLNFYLNAYGQAPWYPTQVAGASTTFSAPSIGLESNNNAVIAAQGPSNSLEFYFNVYGQAPWYPTQVAGAGTTFEDPSIANG